MKNKKMFLIYLLITIILIITITITLITLSTPRKPSTENNGQIQKIEIDRYPSVNDECTFDVSLSEYQSLTNAGCMNGYTRYNINDILLDNKKIEVSIIYSDKDSKKTGLYINNNRVFNKVDNISNIKFGIFDSKLFILDLNNNDSNVLVFNSKKEKLYDLRQYLEKEKTKELATGDTYIKTKDIDSSTYSFNEGYFEFSTKLNKCQEGSNSNGSHYKVSYKKEKFENPEFINLIKC